MEINADPLRQTPPDDYVRITIEEAVRVHHRLQEARSGAAVQGNGQAGRLSGSTAGITTLDSVQGGHHPERVRLVPVRRAVA